MPHALRTNHSPVAFLHSFSHDKPIFIVLGGGGLRTMFCHDRNHTDETCASSVTLNELGLIVQQKRLVNCFFRTNCVSQVMLTSVDNVI